MKRFKETAERLEAKQMDYETKIRNLKAENKELDHKVGELISRNITLERVT